MSGTSIRNLVKHKACSAFLRPPCQSVTRHHAPPDIMSGGMFFFSEPGDDDAGVGAPKQGSYLYAIPMGLLCGGVEGTGAVM